MLVNEREAKEHQSTFVGTKLKNRDKFIYVVVDVRNKSLGLRPHLTTTMFFFCHHVRTVTLVTMKPISDGINNYAENIKSLCHYERTLTDSLIHCLLG